MEFDREKWAREEIRLAIELEKNSRGEKTENDPRDFTDDAINSLMVAGDCYEDILHSGAPRGLVFQMLNQLMQEQPLSPIHEDEDVWMLDPNQPENGTKYVCTRLPTLTKLVTTDENGDEKVEYNDLGRYYCFDLRHSTRPYTGDLAGAVLNEIEPIIFPYHPVGKYAIYTERLRAYETTEDVDTIGILHMRTPSKGLIAINKYFKLTPDKKVWVETDGVDYLTRKKKARDISYKEYKEKMAQEASDGK